MTTEQRLLDELLEAAFRELQHDTGPTDPEYIHQRKVLRAEFKKILSAPPQAQDTPSLPEAGGNKIDEYLNSLPSLPVPTAEQQSSAEAVYFYRHKSVTGNWVETTKDDANRLAAIGNYEFRVLYAAHPPAEAPKPERTLEEAARMLDGIKGNAMIAADKSGSNGSDYRAGIVKGLAEAAHAVRVMKSQKEATRTAEALIGKAQAAAMPPAVDNEIGPTYHVMHPDGSFSVADPQPILLRRAVKQLQEWHAKYGEHLPEWLPPAGGTRLLEDIDAALTSPPAVQTAVPSDLDKLLTTFGNLEFDCGAWDKEPADKPEYLALVDKADAARQALRDHFSALASPSAVPLSDDEILELAEKAGLVWCNKKFDYLSLQPEDKDIGENILDFARALSRAAPPDPLTTCWQCDKPFDGGKIKVICPTCAASPLSDQEQK